MAKETWKIEGRHLVFNMLNDFLHFDKFMARSTYLKLHKIIGYVNDKMW